MVLEERINQLYVVFSKYPVMNERCSYCYGSEGLEYFQVTPLRQIAPEKIKELLYESWDHWESTEVLKHYLPRMLEVMFPPHSILEMYPSHFLTTLNNHDLCEWLPEEKEPVIELLSECKEYFEDYDAVDWQEWEDELDKAKA